MPALKSPRRRPRPAPDRIGVRLMIVARRWRQAVDTELESYGLSHATWRPLLKLACAGGPLRQHELADLLQIGHPELVRLLDNLERKHLVVRQDASDDRRVKRIALTPSGRRIAERAASMAEAFERRTLHGISTQDRARTLEVFARIEERLDLLPPPTKPKLRARTP